MVSVDAMSETEPVRKEDHPDYDPRVGMIITAEGRARARAKLDAADAKWPPERREALRLQLGIRDMRHDRRSRADE